MIPLGPVVARSRVQAARSTVWEYLADADRRAEWWPELQLEPRVGGAVVERWSEGEGADAASRDASGTVDVWVEGHAIGFTWREAGDERDTAVLVTLRTHGRTTGITVTETGFDALPGSADRAAASQDGWEVLLRDLAAAVPVAEALAGAETGAASEAAAEEPAEPVAADADPESPDPERADPERADASADAEPGALEVAEPEIDPELEAAAEAEAEPIEVDPEPAVGDHLELDTGAVEVVGAEASEVVEEDAAADADAAEAVTDDTVVIAAQVGEDPRASSAPDEPDEDDDADDPDFDALIRGE